MKSKKTELEKDAVIRYPFQNNDQEISVDKAISLERQAFMDGYFYAIQSDQSLRDVLEELVNDYEEMAKRYFMMYGIIFTPSESSPYAKAKSLLAANQKQDEGGRSTRQDWDSFADRPQQPTDRDREILTKEDFSHIFPNFDFAFVAMLWDNLIHQSKQTEP